MVIKISGGHRGDDYSVVSDNIVDKIKQFEETITLLKNNYSDDLNFFYFYLIVVLSDYNIIPITDIFNKDDSYLINFYIDRIIKYYESFTNKTASDHLNRLKHEFNVNKDLKSGLLGFLNKLTLVESDEQSIDEIKDKVAVSLNNYKFKKNVDFKVTPFNIQLTKVKIERSTDKFVYLCSLLDFIIQVNNQYLDYFKEYSINNEHNINEIYNLTSQLD